MFVAHELPVGAGRREAQARLANLLHGAWLAEASAAAYDGAVTGLLRVGPAGSASAKLVRVSLLDPVPTDDMVLVPIRWEATGRMGRLFPVLDANLIVGTDGQGRAELRITGAYRPPLDGLGEGLDQAVLYRVAGATLKSLLRGIAATLADPAAAAAPEAPDSGPVTWEALPETP